MADYWSPHVTVAVVVSRGDKFLFVKEHTEHGERINQPAGHVEQGETLAQAACRETLEETGYRVELKGFISLSSYTAPSNGTTYFRATFAADIVEHYPDAPLDTDIIEPLWLTRAELQLAKDLWRSPLVADVIDQYLQYGSQALELGTLHR